MPVALIALTIAAYAIGTTEFVIVGLLPTVASDLHITLPLAGLIVSVYALGVTFGAPILTALTGRLERKPLLLGLMALFIAGNMVAASAPSYEILMIGRVLSAFAHGVFFSVGATIAADLVPENKRGSAIAMMFMGLTVAIVTGVPLGTWIGQNFGWRATFWAVSAIGLVALVGIAALLPRSLQKAEPASLMDQLRVLGSGRLLIVYGMTALGYGGTFVAFTYLTPILQDITGFAEGSVSYILVLYGIAIAIGNIVGGRISNDNPVRALTVLFVLQAIVLVLFSFSAVSPFFTLITLAALGFLQFANVPGLQLYVVQLAKEYRPGAVDVASALNIAAFNLGIALGAWLGGVVVESQLGLIATPWVGAILVGGALVLTVLSGVLDRRTETRVATA
ncbi:MFS transporter [Brucella pituitosa]|uniref:MFS transporter n=1 Tax=Brucella TaxID=234 RepID=UPI00046589E3|nr:MULTISPECIES: MFS transporter [Brucella]PQZ48102.1 MFS transporter [Ochrobactrum sp. MYb19]PRA54366.1 MFS transporter [Ochrobactrum sp. MYb68]PRA64287.1 MFS transporter [Ochrobactrum sp. MYb18]PRA75203.1 MFS transporter [Brucella thiophenivorans]PRA83966.1 MFS transporter [Ochrobactrum sp. MYb29]PRA89586.1 MFS transporter [Ochrobactrum sp. MYb14]PRA96615.1 MFS transporter [Ochrobactrum sp. MYb15]